MSRWEHEHVLEAVQRRLDENPQAVRTRRETVVHPFGSIKARMGATHFLTRQLKNVKTEMALSVLAYNLTRVMNIIGIRPLIQAMPAWTRPSLIAKRFAYGPQRAPWRHKIDLTLKNRILANLPAPSSGFANGTLKSSLLQRFHTTKTLGRRFWRRTW